MSFEFPCSTCEVNCCNRGRGSKTKVFNFDIKKLKKSGSESAQKILDNLEDDRLKTNEDGSCIHLSGTDCKVYADRPVTCWSYPFRMDAFRNLSISTACPSYVDIIKGVVENDAEVMKTVRKYYGKLSSLPAATRDNMRGDTMNHLVTVFINLPSEVK